MVPQLLRELNRREFFNPSLVGVFTNPYFFIKRGVYAGIRANARYMQGVMLDLGCGSKPYKDLFKVDSYVGLEVEPSGHDHRESQIDVLYDGRRMPFRDRVFDSVLAAEVFEHISDLDEVLAELRRVMKPNAHMIVTMPFGWEEHETPHDYIRFTSYGIAMRLRKQGFQVLQVNKTTNYVETCFQIWNAYVTQHVLPSNNYLRFALIPLIVSPATMLGIILSRLLPDNRALYLNNVVVVRNDIAADSNGPRMEAPRPARQDRPIPPAIGHQMTARGSECGRPQISAGGEHWL